MSAIDKSKLLGMNFSTARSRLDRDIMFMLAVSAGHKCHRCGKELDRESFSVDHIKIWSASDDPVASFFDLNNIAFSHAHCNAGYTSRPKAPHGKGGYDSGCRCDVCSDAKRASRSAYDADK